VAPSSTHAAAATTAPAASCPAQSFLQYRGLVYASEPVPASLQLPAGEQLGTGETDSPQNATNPCRRQRESAKVVSIDGVEPSTAVLVQGSAGLGFILGGRCTGFAGAERWACVLSPLSFQGVAYTGIRYPPTPAPQGTVALGDALGSATIGSDQVQVRAIENVDPKLAVGADGRPNEAFVAPGVCPYERFSNTAATNDLLRCLQGPMWFSFSPLGGKPGDSTIATGDRAARTQLHGATLGLVPLRVATDALPSPLGQITPIGTIGTGAKVSLTFDIPDLPQGLYELVIGCKPCASAYGGRTEFPGGSILVLEQGKKSSTPQIIAIVLFALVLVAAVAAVYMWRHGYGFSRRRRGPPEE
jgi:hypothetical protein